MFPSRLHCFLATLALLASPVAAPAEVRTWTDVQGNSIRAEFVRVHDGRVVLKRGSQTTLVPLNQLSPADQQYVQNQLDRKNGLPKASPPAEGTAATSGETSTPPRKITPQERIWTDTAGNTLTATFVRVHQTDVVLTQGNRVRTISYLLLSNDDKNYVKDVLRGQGQEDVATALDQFVQEAEARAKAEREATAAANPPPSSPPPPVGGGLGPFSPPGMGPSASSGSSLAEQARQRFEEQQQEMERRRQEAQQQREQQMAAERERREREAAERQQRYEAERQRWQQQQQEQHERIQQASAGLRPPAPSDGDAGGPSTEMSYYCSNCQKPVPSHIGAGENCPNCGVYFEYEETPSGQRRYASGSSGGFSRVRVKGIVSLVILICGIGAAIWRKIAG